MWSSTADVDAVTSLSHFSIINDYKKRIESTVPSQSVPFPIQLLSWENTRIVAGTDRDQLVTIS